MELTALEQYAVEWAEARCRQGGYVFAWENQGKMHHFRTDSLDDAKAYAFHAHWVIADTATAKIVDSSRFAR